KIRTDIPVDYDITHFAIIGSTLELEGYASSHGLLSYSEDKIRKILMLVPEVDTDLFRQKHGWKEEFEEITDREIISMHTIEIPLDNCKFKHVKNSSLSKIEDKDSLGGFRLALDLAEISNDKPLEQGNYNVFIKPEQLFNDND